jgi:hypothetical protein
LVKPAQRQGVQSLLHSGVVSRILQLNVTIYR